MKEKKSLKNKIREKLEANGLTVKDIVLAVALGLLVSGTYVTIGLIKIHNTFNKPSLAERIFGR